MNGQLRKLKEFLQFMGPRVVRLLLLSSVIGFGLSMIELAFAYGLQALFIALKLMAPEVVQLPAFFPAVSTYGVLIFVLMIGICRGLLQGVQFALQGYVFEEMRYTQRSRILNWAFHSDSASSSHVISLFDDRVNNTSGSIMSIQGVIMRLSTAVSLLVYLLIIAPRVTIAAVSVLLVLSSFMRPFNKRIFVASQGLKQEWDKTNRSLLVNLKNLLLIQIYGTQDLEESKAQGSLGAYRKHFLNYYHASGFRYALPQILGVILICLIVLNIEFMKDLSPGGLVTYLYVFVRFVQTASETTKHTSFISLNWPQVTQLASWWRGVQGTQKQYKKSIFDTVKALSITSSVGWKLSGVSFVYPGSHSTVVSKLNLSVPSGSVLAITGPSGVGKSTILGLMLGVIQPTSGEIKIFIEGQATDFSEEIKQAVLHRIGYVGPESFLIEGTIYENLLYGLNHVPSQADLQEAIHQSECHFIYDLPRGLDHYLTEQGQGLSAGQKQRLALTRALLRKPTALVLDEATSNLDFETEAKIIRTLSQLKGKMTILAVSHKEAILQIADHQLNLTTPIDEDLRVVHHPAPKELQSCPRAES